MDAPSSGADHFLQLEHTPNRKTTAYLRYTHRSRQLNGNDEEAKLYPLSPIQWDKLRLHIRYALTRDLSIQTRAELVLYGEQNTQKQEGFLVYQQAAYGFDRVPLKISGRYTIFDVKDFNARIYTLEQDMPYTFSIPAFQDEGNKWYLLVQYRMLRKLKFYFKISRLAVYNKETLGTDLMELPAPRRTEVKGMMVWEM